MTSPAPAPASACAADRAALRRMVAFIRAKLVKTASLGPAGTFPALSETAERFNDSSWFWTDDNAKAAELLCEPSFYDEDPATADAAIDFVLRMSQGAIIQRRCGPPELRVLSADPKSFRVETAFSILEGDLSRGVVRHALRFNDGRTVAAARHGGRNAVLLRHAGRTVALDVDDAITACDVRTIAGGRTVVLSHTSALKKPAWWPAFGGGGAAAVLGHVTYAYAVSADSPSVALEVTLTPTPGTALRDVVLCTALGGLGDVPDVDYRTLAVRATARGAAGAEDRFLRAAPSKQGRTMHSGPAEYWAVVQGGASPGFSYAMHVLPREGATVAGIQVQAQRLGTMRWVQCRYAVGNVAEGTAAIRVREERMLTGGGYYDALGHYAAVMRDGAAEGSVGGHIDPSMSYDIGAELNAVAAHVLFARTGQYGAPPSRERLERLAAWYDRHVQRYFDFVRPGAPDDLDRVFTRGLAFVVMSLDCMLRATGDARYRALMDTGVGLILRTQRREGRGSDSFDATFADTWSGLVPFLDNHAACLLALARAAWHGDPSGTLARAIHEGVLGIRLHTGTVHLGDGHREAYDGLAVLNNVPQRAMLHADTGFWTFKLGLTLRALHAVGHAAEAGVIPMDEAERERLALRRDLARTLLARAMRRHGEGMLEVLTSPIAGETNSETQPWVALGLVPVVDERIVRLGRSGASPSRAEAA